MYVPESRCVGIQIMFTPNKRYMYMYQFIFSSWHIFPVNTLKYTGEALTVVILDLTHQAITSLEF